MYVTASNNQLVYDVYFQIVVMDTSSGVKL